MFEPVVVVVCIAHVKAIVTIAAHVHHPLKLEVPDTKCERNRSQTYLW